MFCPKCGTQNPDTGKFCRACGTDLGNVSAALTGRSTDGFEKMEQIKSWKKKHKPISYESAITKMFSGLGFLILAIVLGVTKVAGAQFWWFWMLILAFGALGSGIAQYVQLKKTEQQQQNPQNAFNYPAPDNRLLTPEDAANVIQNQLQAGNKIEAIRIHREVYGTSLKDAKEAVERIESERSSFSYYNSSPQGSIYDTGELTAPPSVTENTTRHLEINKDGETMTLPKK